jgi:oxygen-independent coproporphyrinogen-3 oxidase
MAGIYIHIPFCKKRCIYCDSYSSTYQEYIPPLIDAIIKELKERKDYLQNETVETIYFGGGTPSLLTENELGKILAAIFENYPVEETAEITLEANPDDLISGEYLSSLRKLKINRLSIGIQSFDDEKLKFLNRRHTAGQAIQAVRSAHEVGFNNISIDLIYAIPGQTFQQWEKELNIAFSLPIQHLSAYELTYEKQTLLGKQKQKGLITPVDEEISIKMYETLLEEAKKHRFERYEISNFALPGSYSRHNSAYWEQKIYIGIGPSAHSYNSTSRQWNVSSVEKYIKAIEHQEKYFEKEKLTLNQQYNEYLMVSLRTAEGLDLNKLEEKFGTELKNECLKSLKIFMNNDFDHFNG